MKKILKAIGIVIVAPVLAVLVIWSREISTLRTVHQVDGNKYLYTMEYRAGYDLDRLVESDIDGNAAMLNYIAGCIGKGIIHLKTDGSKAGSAEVNCTSFQTASADGGWLYGRNYDFFKNPTMVTLSRPKDGYASIAVSDMSHFGYGLEKLPEGFLSRLLCLASIYVPVDGMNEKGLCTSIMALPKMPAQQDSGKHRIGTTIVMRLILDRCATVDEALELLSAYDIRHDVGVGSGYHYMIADARGDCAVLEFDMEDGWKSMVIRKEEGEKSMLVTNHLLSPKFYSAVPEESVGNVHSKSWWRYDTARDYIDAHDGCLSREEAQECLSLVHWKDLVWDNGLVEDTQYSCVYDQSALELLIRNWNDYGTTVRFAL